MPSEVVDRIQQLAKKQTSGLLLTDRNDNAIYDGGDDSDDEDYSERGRG